jgi:hypothetical protein
MAEDSGLLVLIMWFLLLFQNWTIVSINTKGQYLKITSYETFLLKVLLIKEDVRTHPTIKAVPHYIIWIFVACL